MKYLFLVCLILSCSQKFQRKLISKGYDLSKDTIIVKPYEYFIKYSGYGIQYKELHPSKTEDIEIGIKGFEKSNSIPIAVLKDTFQIYVSDTAIKKIMSGEIIYRYKIGANTFYPKDIPIDSLKLSYNFYIKKFRRLMDKHFVLFWNFNIQRGDEIITIPARKYSIEY